MLIPVNSAELCGSGAGSRAPAPRCGVLLCWGFASMLFWVQSCPDSSCFGPIRGAGLRARGEFAFFLRFRYISGLQFQFGGFW